MSDHIPPELRAALAAEAKKEATDSDTRSQVEIKEAMTQLLEQYTNLETGQVILDSSFFERAIPLQEQFATSPEASERAKEALKHLYRLKAATMAREMSERHNPIEGVSQIEGKAARLLEWADFIEPFADAVEAKQEELKAQGIPVGSEAYADALKPLYVDHLHDMADKVRALTGVEDPFFLELSDIDVFPGYNTDSSANSGGTEIALFNNGQTPSTLIPSFTMTVEHVATKGISKNERLSDYFDPFKPTPPYDTSVTDPGIYQHHIGQEYTKSGTTELYGFHPDTTATNFLHLMTQRKAEVNETDGFSLIARCPYLYTDKEGTPFAPPPPNWIAGFPPCLRPMILLAQYQDADLQAMIQEVQRYVSDNPDATTLPDHMVSIGTRSAEVFSKYYTTTLLYSSQRLPYLISGKKETPLTLPGERGSYEFYRQCMEAYQDEHNLPRQRPIEEILNYTPPTETE